MEIGKQMLITRGALTTFSVANDVAKYFAIIPAMLIAVFPVIAPLNIMQLRISSERHLERSDLQCPHHCALIPLALRGVSSNPWGRNLCSDATY